MAIRQEAWSSRLGVILAVAGSAVGLGNFLRFPGLAAKYGGAEFMIAYFISLALIGIPICWMEWTLGRRGGCLGYHSTSGIFHALLRRPWAKYLGVIGFVVPVLIFMYYVYVEAWTLGYAVHAAVGTFRAEAFDAGAFFGTFTGAGADGSALNFDFQHVGVFLVLVFALNLYFIYRGLSHGIELVCKYAMPALLVIAVLILVRVLTLGTPDPLKPDQNVLNGLGYLWNPRDLAAGLSNPELWLAAAGQIFFSLSVGFGVIITYASYLKKQDDVVLSGLTASATNEFCEVCLGGLITVPAAFVFLGAAGIVGMGTFSLGFMVLPQVFALMPFGQVFAAAFFFLLFLAAITSSLSMLQPGIAFLEEGLGLDRKASVALLGLVTAIGTLFVWYFSKDLMAMDTIDFWAGTFLLLVQGTILVLIFGWGIGIRAGFEEAHRGALLRIPGWFGPVMKYVTPVYLLGILALWVLGNVFGWNFSFSEPVFQPTSYITNLVGPKPNPVAQVSFAFMAVFIIFSCVLVALAGRRWEKQTPSITP